ncbi:MAG: YHYH protein [Undibacterium sp.]|nr:YHYH protein [Opitutaceae bacterium]
MNRLPIFLAAMVVTASVVRAADPQLESWQTGSSRRYARLYESDAAKAAGTSVITWSRGQAAQTSPTYAGVIQISSSASWVYLRTTGLGTHVMGPWYINAAHTVNFPNFPANTGAIFRFPRTPTIPTTKTPTGLAAIGFFVDGVAAFDNRDAFSYVTASGTDAGPTNGLRGDGVWNREAYANEGVTFDAAFAHQAGTNYHYHANTPALRFQLGDNVDYNATTKTYAEKSTLPTAHSPILGWMADGLPIYGPYGYASPMSPASGVRRMTTGYVKRDGANGTTNLSSTGRITIPVWATRAQGRGATLLSTLYGPAVGTAYPLGNYIEDYDYLGDLGKTQGADFDLNDCNVRFCVTPEFPAGTYAYFLTIEADGTPKFPNTVGRWFFGNPTGGSVAAINETVTEYVRASQASAISVTATSAMGTVTIRWTSAEGATYKIETSADATTWSVLSGASAVTSSGGDTTSFLTAVAATNYRVTLTALATYDTRGAGGLSGVGNSASATVAVGAAGTARLVNIASRVALGGAAGTPIAGFVLGGVGTKAMLARAVGPTLANFNVSGVLADPRLGLVSGTTTVASNDNWLAADAATMSAAGAFALAAGSKDAALVATLGAGGYTLPVTATDGGSGVALLEVYDAASSTTLNVVNASTRAYVGTGDAVLIPGFVVAGTGSLRLLVRAVGPALANFGVAGVLADPALTLYSGTKAVATNDNWSSGADATELSAAGAAVGAFALTTGSKDAAILTTLPAGAYTAVVSGVGSTTGTALVEIYVIP